MAEKDTQKPNKITNQINSLLHKLQQCADPDVVPNDKTNSYVILKISSYIEKVNQHLSEGAIKTWTKTLNEKKKKWNQC